MREWITTFLLAATVWHSTASLQQVRIPGPGGAAASSAQTPALTDTPQVANLNSGAAGTTTITLTTPVAGAGEALYLFAVNIASGTVFTTPTDSASDTGTTITQVTNIPNGTEQDQYVICNPTTGVTTVSLTQGGAGNGRLYVEHWKNMHAGACVDTSATSNNVVGTANATYTSGGSFTGSTSQTCNLSFTNGGGTGATATVALTGTNAVAGGTALTITAGGSNFTSRPTSATLSSGTATCSGTATVSVFIQGPLSPWNSEGLTTTQANDALVGGSYAKYSSGAACAMSASGSWTRQNQSNNISATGDGSAVFSQIVSSTQSGTQLTGTDSNTTGCSDTGNAAALKGGP